MPFVQSISIPQTCNQSWEKMTRVNDGRHCQTCCKTVIDFTAMSSPEIINHLSTRNNGNICGRFNQFQINSLNDELSDNKSKRYFKWSRFIAAASVICVVAFSKATAKAKVIYNTAQTPVIKNPGKHADTVLKTIRGRISFNNKNKKAVINIRVKGTPIVDVTNTKGEFKLQVPINADTLEISSPPYKTQYVKIDPANKSRYDIKFDEKNSYTVVMGGILVKPGTKFNKDLLIRSSREIGNSDSAVVIHR